MRKILNKILTFFKKPGRPVLKKQKRILVKSKDKIIGIIQSMSIDTKPKHPLIYIGRALFSKEDIAKLFMNNRYDLSSMKYPFQIEIIDGNNITRINNVWITSNNFSYITDDLVVADGLNCEAENIEYIIN